MLILKLALYNTSVTVLPIYLNSLFLSYIGTIISLINDYVLILVSKNAILKEFHVNSK